MAGVVYYTGAYLEFLCVRSRRNVRATKAFQTGFMLPLNKHEGKCSFSFFFYSISGNRSARYNLYGKKLRVKQ